MTSVTSVTCGSCGEQNVTSGEPCPVCGFTTTAKLMQAAVSPSGTLAGRHYAQWGSDELTLVGIVVAVVIGLAAIAIPMPTWWARLAVAGGGLALLIGIAIWKEPVIRAARRYLRWRGRGRRVL